jgi:hypothetical protein
LVKSNITLYGDTEQATRLKEAGWNLSRLFKSTLDMIDSQEYEDANILLKVRYYDEELAELESEVNDLRAALYVKTHRLERIRQEKDQLLKDWEIARRSARMQKYTKELNKHVIECQFDIDMISNNAKEILSGIYEVNPDFKLDRHVKRLKTLIEN